MKDVWTILSILESHGVDFNIQCLNFPAGSKYNLRVNDIYGKTHYLHAFKNTELASKLKVIWGGLLTGDIDLKGVDFSINKKQKPKPSMPLPTGMPMP